MWSASSNWLHWLSGESQMHLRIWECCSYKRFFRKSFEIMTCHRLEERRSKCNYLKWITCVCGALLRIFVRHCLNKRWTWTLVTKKKIIFNYWSNSTIWAALPSFTSWRAVCVGPISSSIRMGRSKVTKSIKIIIKFSQQKKLYFASWPGRLPKSLWVSS